MEIRQKKIGPDYHRLKTMVKRSIEQDIRNKNFGARNGNYERNAVVKNQGTKQRRQRILGGCWQWEANKQFSKKTIVVSVTIFSTVVVSVTIFSTEGFQMEMLIRTPSRRVILICVCG